MEVVVEQLSKLQITYLVFVQIQVEVAVVLQFWIDLTVLNLVLGLLADTGY